MKLIRVLSIAFAVFTVVLTVVFFSWWAMKDRLVFGSKPFDPIAWMQAANTIEQTCDRGDMAYDLQQHILLPGAKRDKIMMLLGRPSFEAFDSVEYDLGKCMHVYHGLLLFFDPDGRLLQSRIESH